MPSAATTKAKSNGTPGPKHNVDAVRRGLLRTHCQARHGAALEGDELRRHQGAGDALVPHVWQYDDVKALVMELGGLISAEEALRRVLILENPALHGESPAPPIRSSPEFR